MLDLITETRSRKFQELGPIQPNTHEINGSATHHCAICPEPRHERCTKSCETERKKLDSIDGVTVTVP